MPRKLSRRTLLSRTAALTLLTLADIAEAGPRRYVLVPSQSSIVFAFRLNGSPQTGTVPIVRAEFTVDTGNLAASSADVSADLRGAKTGFFFATEALKSPQVLDAGNHRLVRYVTQRINLGRSGQIFDGATVDGLLTMRGITRPLRLAAQLTRPPGTAETDLARLYIRLSGSLARSDFGASGYSDIVADRVDLDIRAAIAAA
ncbi:YceI family protein [Sulfitobacter sp. LCG007]